MAIRDFRIDFVRGIALLILFSDHVRGNIIYNYTPIAFGLSDMSDVFIFLSGYSCGLSYGSRLTDRGFINCAERAWARAAQLYIVKVIITIVALAILFLAEGRTEPVFFGLPWNMQLVKTNPIETIIAIETFRLELLQFFILALYVAFLLLLPLVVAGLSAYPYLIWFISAFVYSLVQMFPMHICLPQPWRDALFFNPFAWQFLFFCACAIAMLNPTSRSRLRPKPLIVIVALMVVCLLFVIRSEFGVPWKSVLINKQNLGLLRLLHFTCIVIVGYCAIPSSHILLRSRLARPFINCGQNALVGYCTGGFLAIFSEMALRALSPTWTVQLGINFAGWVGCLVVTSSWGRFRQGRKTSQ